MRLISFRQNKTEQCFQWIKKLFKFWKRKKNCFEHDQYARFPVVVRKLSLFIHKMKKIIETKVQAVEAGKNQCEFVLYLFGIYTFLCETELRIFM